MKPSQLEQNEYQIRVPQFKLTKNVTVIRQNPVSQNFVHFSKKSFIIRLFETFWKDTP